MDEFFLNVNKRSFLSKRQIFQALRSFNVELYQNQKVHFKDMFIQMSMNIVQQQAVQQKQDVSKIEYACAPPPPLSLSLGHSR